MSDSTRQLSQVVMAFMAPPGDAARVPGYAPDANAAQPNSSVRKRTLINDYALLSKWCLELYAGMMEVEKVHDIDQQTERTSRAAALLAFASSSCPCGSTLT